MGERRGTRPKTCGPSDTAALTPTDEWGKCANFGFLLILVVQSESGGVIWS